VASVMSNKIETKKNILKYLSPADIVTQCMLFILTLILIYHSSNVRYWYVFIPVNIILIFSIYKIVNTYEAKVSSSGGVEGKNFSLLKLAGIGMGCTVCIF
jgi:hypothetical protein